MAPPWKLLDSVSILPIDLSFLLANSAREELVRFNDARCTVRFVLQLPPLRLSGSGGCGGLTTF